VWRNQTGGLTFRYVDDGADRFLTWVPGDSRDQLEAAVARAKWLAPFLTVPRFSSIGEAFGGYFATSAGLPGVSAVSAWGKQHPELAVQSIAEGLRRLHENAPVAECPFVCCDADRVERAKQSLSDPSWRVSLDGFFDQVSDAEALAALDGLQLGADPVVCHGDPCAPNTILDDRGFVGIVDLGALGVGDRWLDLSVAAWSLNWNFGPGFEDLFYSTYGLAPDPETVLAYRLLWHLSD
jgi:kanamycin kinase